MSQKKGRFFRQSSCTICLRKDVRLGSDDELWESLRAEYTQLLDMTLEDFQALHVKELDSFLEEVKSIASKGKFRNLHKKATQSGLLHIHD